MLRWKKRQEFTLSVIGYVVGMGNVVFFPRLAYRNGGIVFLIPYFIMVMCLGLPMMMMEISFGQFCSRGVTKCWGFSKIFSGMGLTLVLTLSLHVLYYNVLVAWSIYYFGATFTFYQQPDNQLPWAVCNNESTWLSVYSTCRLNMTFPESTNACLALNYTESNGVCYVDAAKELPYGYTNLTLARQNDSLRPITTPEDYFRNVVNKKSDNPEGVGELNPFLILCLFAAWTLVFVCVCKGIRSIGKVVYVTATVPYIILFIMITYGATLENSTDCLTEFLQPNFERLREPKVWHEAAIQALFSLSIGLGGLITLSAYNDFNNDTFRSTIIVVIVDTVTSLVATVTLFMYLGVLSHDINVRSCDVIKDDPYLAFHVFAYAMTKLPLPPVWSTLFFFMMIMLGLDTLIANVETIVGSIIETWVAKLGNKGIQVHFLACAVFFICSLLFSSSRGLYWYGMFSKYVFSWNKLVTVFLLAVAITWVYGVSRFRKDIGIMINSAQCCCTWKKLGGVFEPFWKFVIPLGLLVLLVYMLVTWESVGVWWLDMLGWFISGGSLLPIPIVAVILTVRAPGNSFKEKLENVSKPTAEWGPVLTINRILVDYVPGLVVDVEEYYSQKLRGLGSIRDAGRQANDHERDNEGFTEL